MPAPGSGRQRRRRFARPAVGLREPPGGRRAGGGPYDGTVDEQAPLHQRDAPTHYQVLGVDATADQTAIRRAYHEAARRWHPDRLAGMEPAEATQAEIQIRRVNQAWEVLGREDRRAAYDRQLRLWAGDPEARTAEPRAGVRNENGVFRIDPRLLDPEFLAARRHAQFDEIGHRQSIMLRVVPVLAVLGLLAGIFIFTAYARNDPGSVPSPTTVSGPSLGSGIKAGDCVTVLGGPALIARPCDAAAAGRVIGAHEDVPNAQCPVGTTREVPLANGVVACLAPVR